MTHSWQRHFQGEETLHSEFKCNAALNYFEVRIDILFELD